MPILRKHLNPKGPFSPLSSLLSGLISLFFPGPQALLITTSYSFLKMDLKTFTISPIHRGSGLYYGITSSSDYYYVAARRRMVSSEIPIEEERGVILLFDKRLRFITELSSSFPLRDMHEIKWYKNKLWITCSYDNMIAIFDGRNWSKWYPLGKPETEPFDRNHFNSFYFEDGSIYILAHNRGDSEILEFSLDTLKLKRRIPLGNQAHNIWKKGEVFYTCSSGEGKLKGTDGWELFTGGFPRGIAFTKTHVYVGVSELAERKDRDFTTGKLLIFNSHWELLQEIPLEKEGLILDLHLYP